MSLTTALFLAFIVGMIAMHLRGHKHSGAHGGHGGHGGCGGHGHGHRDQPADPKTAADPPPRDHAHV